MVLGPGLAAALGIVALGAAGPLAAQQHDHGAAAERARHHARMERSDRLLDEKLAAVDSLRGDAKVDALAAVVKELIAQRRAMHARMREGMAEGPMKSMMEGPMKSMMEGNSDSVPGPARERD
jgi:hypothetical protein